MMDKGASINGVPLFWVVEQNFSELPYKDKKNVLLQN